MRVASFKVSNYRSIDSAEVELADLTCLVGPNNEGKSNLLRALGLGLNVVLGHGRPPRRSMGRVRRGADDLIAYDPTFDRPVGKESRSLTTITIRFELTDTECERFREEIGHSLNGDLPAQVQFTLRGEPRVQYKKQRVGSQLTDKADAISAFLQERLTFQYVPAIRTAEDAALVINTLIRNRLLGLRSDQEFQDAQEVIRSKFAEALVAVEQDLKDVLPRFLPQVAGVHIEMDPVRGPLGFDSGVRSIQVDDGATTELTAKGSGVQSLAALALLRHGLQSDNSDRASLLALEEPEAHLHSGALHQLRPLLAEIAAEQQLVFATHAAVLVPTSVKASTVIVRNNHARTSKALADVREALGVKLSDNLESSRLVLVVEGTADVTFWRTVLGGGDSGPLADALESGLVAVENTVGASNLSYQLQTLRRSACDAYVVFDGDAPGRAAINAALKEDALSESDYLLLAWDGQPQAELEDLLAAGWVENVLRAHFGEPITIPDGEKKWSDRLKGALTGAGKSNSPATIEGVKRAIWSAFDSSSDAGTSDRGTEIVERVQIQLSSRLGLD